MHLVDPSWELISEIYPRRRGDVEILTMGQYIQRINMLAQTSYMKVVMVDTLPIAIVGLSAYGNKGNLWMVGTTDIPKHKKSFTRIIKNTMVDYMNMYNLHRVQTEVLADQPTWIKWNKLLGMELEGYMKKYTIDKKDCVLMACVR